MQALIGQTLGQYEIVEKIGEGGMGTVFKARQPDLERWVAVKVLPQYTAAPGFKERFLREARAIAQLEHPNILPVHDFGQQDQYIYLVMRYVEDSRTLSNIMCQSLSFQQITDYLGQVADALDYAHRRGIIHRDVKPGNVLLNSDDWIFLADFGLARIMNASTHLTGTGMGVGTPAYMSPEQGSGRKVDARTDVYAIGVIAFQMLTGQIPHHAESPHAIIYKRNTEPPPSLRDNNPDIPLVVDQCVQTALSLNPNERFQSPGTFVAALRQAIEESEAGNLMNSTMSIPRGTPYYPLPHLSPQRFCSQCGTRIEPEMRFCGNCGSPVTTPIKDKGVSVPTSVPQRPRPAGRATRSRQINLSPGFFWGSMMAIGILLFVLGMTFGVIQIVIGVVAILLALGGIYLYQHFEDWFDL
jgi:serine/threonine protein kinase